MGTQKDKLFNKQASSRSNVDSIKRIDGRDEQIADVRGGNLDTNAITRRVINAGAVGFDEIGREEVGGSRIYSGGVQNNHLTSGAVSNSKMQDGVVSNSKIQDGVVTPNKLDRDYLTQSEGDNRYVRDVPSRTGSADGLVGDHSHSISSTPFIKKPRSERMRMLGDRLDLEELLYSGHLHPEDAIIARNTLNLLTLLMDYRSLNAYQRERAFVTPGLEGWTDTYKRVYGVDEYAEDDRNNFLRYGDVRMDPYTGIAPADREPASPGN